MPETAIERLRRLAGLPAQQDVTAVKPKPVFQPSIKPLRPVETEAQIYERRGRELKAEDRRLMTPYPKPAKADHQLVTPPGRPNLRAAQDATAVRVITPPGQPTIGPQKNEDVVNPDYLRGLARQKANAANYQSNPAMADVASRLEEEARLGQEHPGALGTAVGQFAQSAVPGITHIPGARSVLLPGDVADEQLRGRPKVTAAEMRSSGMLSPEEETPALPGEGQDYNRHPVAGMIGGMAGFAVPIGVQNALISRGLRGASLLGRTSGFKRLGGIESGMRRAGAFERPASLAGRMAKTGGEFVVPGAGMAASEAADRGEDPLRAAAESVVPNLAMGAAFPVAGRAVRFAKQEVLPYVREGAAEAGANLRHSLEGGIGETNIAPEGEAAMPAIEKLRRLAMPVAAGAILHPAGQTTLAAIDRLRALDQDPRVKQAAIAASGAYALANAGDQTEEGSPALPLAIGAVGAIASHGHEGKITSVGGKPPGMKIFGIEALKEGGWKVADSEGGYHGAFPTYGSALAKLHAVEAEHLQKEDTYWVANWPEEGSAHPWKILGPEGATSFEFKTKPEAEAHAAKMNAIENPEGIQPGWYYKETQAGDYNIIDPNGNLHDIVDTPEEAQAYVTGKNYEQPGESEGFFHSDFIGQPPLKKSYPPESEHANKGVLGMTVEDHAARFRAGGMNRRANNLEKFMKGSIIRKPLLHGTKENFDTFERGELGFHFTADPTTAGKRTGTTMGHAGHIMPVWVNIKNPLRVHDPGTWLGAGFRQELVDLHVITPAEAAALDRAQHQAWNTAYGPPLNGMTDFNTVRWKEGQAIRDLLKEKGYDGIVYRNDYEHGGDSWIAFDSNQIKSVTGNKGTFNARKAAIVSGAALAAKALTDKDEQNDDKAKIALAAGAILAHHGTGPGARDAIESELRSVVTARREAEANLWQIHKELKRDPVSFFANKQIVSDGVNWKYKLDQLRKHEAALQTALKQLPEKPPLPDEAGRLAVGAGAVGLSATGDQKENKNLKLAAMVGGLSLLRGKGLRAAEKAFTGSDVVIGHLVDPNLAQPLHERLTEMARAATEPKEKALLQKLAGIGQTAYDADMQAGANAIDAGQTAATAIREAAAKTEKFDKMRLLTSGASNVINKAGDFEPADFTTSQVRDALQTAKARLVEAKQNREPRSDLVRATNGLRTILGHMKAGDDFQTASQKLNLNDRHLIVEHLPGPTVLRSRTGEPLGETTPVREEDFASLPDEAAQRIFKGQYLYANPIDPKMILDLYKAHPTVFHGAGLAFAGSTVAQQGENLQNQKLEWTGKGMMGLGFLHALGAHATASGKPLYQDFAAKVGNKMVDALKNENVGSIKGRHVLDFISHDILASPELRKAADEFERNRARAAAISLEFKAKLRRLGDIGNRAVTDEITKETWEPQAKNMTPQEAQAVVAAAAEVRNEFAIAGAEEVALGTMARGQYEAHTRRGFIPYRYPEWEAARARGIGRGEVQTTAVPRVRAHKRRMDIPEAERRKMGQIRESDYLVQQGLQKNYNNIAAAKLFSQLTMIPGSIHPEYEKAVKDLMAANQSGSAKAIKAATARIKKIRVEAAGDLDRGSLAGYRTLPTSSGLGVLSGAVVRNDIASYLEGLPAFGKKSVPQDLFMLWKKIHTVWNPGTHIGNFASNIVTVHMKGLPYWELPKALRAANRSIRTYDKYARALTEAGVMDQNLATFDYSAGMAHTPRSNMEQLRELAGRALPETKQKLAELEVVPHGPEQHGTKVGKAISTVLQKAGRPTDKWLAEKYNLEDNWFRVALLRKVTQPPGKGGLGLNMAQGVEYVRHHMGDFRTRSTALKMARWYSPFVMYPAKMIPHMLGSVIEHPFRWTTLAASWGAIDQLSAYAQGRGDLTDVNKRIKTGRINEMDMPEDQRSARGFGYMVPGAIQLPFGGGRATKFASDISRYTPFSFLSGAPAPGSLAAALTTRVPVPAGLSPGGPLSDLYARTQVNADPYTGEKWIDPNDTPAQKWRKIAGAMVANQVLPSALAWHLPRVAKDVSNRDISRAAMDALGFAGVRPRTVIPGRRAKLDKYWKQDSKEAAKRERNAELRAAVKASPARRNAIEQDYQEKIRRIMTEYQRRNTRPK